MLASSTGVTATAVDSDWRTAGGADPHSSAAAAVVRPNVVVIMADDMRVDDLRWMPATRRLLGGQGVTFGNSFSPYPLCCPARASFLTGQYAHNHEVWSTRYPSGFHAFDDRSTLPVWLQDSGYLTGFVGKYLNGYGSVPTRQGRASIRYVPPGWTDWRAAVEGMSKAHPLFGSTYNYEDTTLNRNGSLVGNEGVYQTRLFTDHAAGMIDRFSGRSSPFFLYASYVAPHHGRPRDPDDPPRRIERKDGRLVEVRTPAVPAAARNRFDHRITRVPGYRRYEDVSQKPTFIRSLPPLNRQERRAVLELTRQRADTLQVLDRQVARIIDALRANGELRNTVIVFTSDNGYLLGEHRIRQGKTLPYEPSLRVPLLMRGPGLPNGASRLAPVTSLDLAPTIAALAGVNPPRVVDGRSILPVARRDQGWLTGVVTETGSRRSLSGEENESGVGALGPTAVDDEDERFSLGLRTDRWLYVRHQSGDVELYDMAADPQQLVNLADRRAYQRELRALRRQLARLRDCAGAECREPLVKSLRVPNGRLVSGRRG
jgi:arylsulfatase A-like enzyme